MISPDVALTAFFVAAAVILMFRRFFGSSKKPACHETTTTTTPQIRGALAGGLQKAQHAHGHSSNS